MLEYLLARGRALSEQLMEDTCLIRRRTGQTTDNDGNITPTYAPVYEGKCRLKQPMAQARPDEAGEAQLLMLRRELQLPIEATGVRADDEVMMTDSRYDPDLAGREFVVRGLHHATHATKRRLQVEERTS